MNYRLLFITALYAGGLLAIGCWRYLSLQGDASGAGQGPTWMFIIWTIGFAVNLPRLGVVLNRVGFGLALRPVHFGLAVLGVLFIQLYAAFAEPLLAELLESERNLSRFDGVIGSLPQLIMLLVFSWLFAAVGEEIAFRVLLLRLLRSVFGTVTAATVMAVAVQALVFGLVHLYQGPVGVAGACVSGLVFGSIVVIARGSIWPAVLAHGLNNSIGLTLLYFQ